MSGLDEAGEGKKWVSYKDSSDLSFLPRIISKKGKEAKLSKYPIKISVYPLAYLASHSLHGFGRPARALLMLQNVRPKRDHQVQYYISYRIA